MLVPPNELSKVLKKCNRDIGRVIILEHSNMKTVLILDFEVNMTIDKVKLRP